MRVAAIVGLLLIGTSALAKGPGEDDGTVLRIYVIRKVDDRNLNVFWAETIASQIFAGAGVHIKWQLGEPKRKELYSALIIDLTSDTPKALAPGALACAQVYEGVHIRVFWDRVERTVSGAHPLDTFLMAHVMAHEIAHILECIDRHSETGLMKARWTRKEIQEMCIHPLSLAPEDVRLIRQRLEGRATKRAVAHIGCG